MSNERTRNNKNKKQNSTDTSKPNSSAVNNRKPAKTLSGDSRGTKKNARLQKSSRSVQGRFSERFWEEGWDE